LNDFVSPKLSDNANLHNENRKRKGVIDDEEEDQIEKLIYGNIGVEKTIKPKINLPPSSNNNMNSRKFGNKKNKMIDDDEEDDVFSTNLDDALFKF
jgi:hypothetical protein